MQSLAYWLNLKSSRIELIFQDGTWNNIDEKCVERLRDEEWLQPMYMFVDRFKNEKLQYTLRL